MSFTPAEGESLLHTPIYVPCLQVETFPIVGIFLKDSYLIFETCICLLTIFTKVWGLKKDISRTFKNYLIQFGVKRKVISRTNENYSKLCPDNKVKI